MGEAIGDMQDPDCSAARIEAWRSLNGGQIPDLNQGGLQLPRWPRAHVSWLFQGLGWRIAVQRFRNNSQRMLQTLIRQVSSQ